MHTHGAKLMILFARKRAKRKEVEAKTNQRMEIELSRAHVCDGKLN